MQQYLDLLKDVLENGKEREDVQGVGNIAVCGRQMRFRPSVEFPLLTTKKVNFPWIAHELLWFLSGERRIDYLQERGVTLWDLWASKEISESMGLKEGDPGPIYGPKWRHWPKREGGEIDQIANLIKEIKEMPHSKRMKVTTWDPEDAGWLFLAPCHGTFKCFVAEGEISLHLFQRSCDLFIGIPFNIASYSLLLLMIAQVTDLKPGEFIHTLSDTHIYLNHLDQVQLQLKREPRPLPTVAINPGITDIDDFTIDDFELVGYDPHPFIKADVAL